MKVWVIPPALGLVVALSWLALDRESFLHGGYLAVLLFSAVAAWLVATAERSERELRSGEDR